jgi:hypothetical protein
MPARVSFREVMGSGRRRAGRAAVLSVETRLQKLIHRPECPRNWCPLNAVA